MNSEAPVCRIAIAGVGAVGAALASLLEKKSETLSRRAGHRIEVVAVSARDRHKARPCPLDGIDWWDDPVRMASEADIDILVEVIGGGGDPALATCHAALAAGRHVVTANKALIAAHGLALAQEAERRGVSIACEAAVGGAIPVLRVVREGLAGATITAVRGILNGTCNYILSTMAASGRSFDDALQEAQRLGYAESDPAFDISGADTAHKLAILSSLAFSIRPAPEATYVEGVQDITAEDIASAAEMGYRVKLLGIAESWPNGVRQRVHPALVPLGSPIASVDGVLNAILLDSAEAGPTFLEGQGAGGTATATAIVGDIVGMVRGIATPLFGTSATALEDAAMLSMDDHISPAYLRLTVADQPGVIADIADILREQQISIKSMLQRTHTPEEPVSVILILHPVQEAALRRALTRLHRLDAVLRPPRFIRIERRER